LPWFAVPWLAVPWLSVPCRGLPWLGFRAVPCRAVPWFSVKLKHALALAFGVLQILNVARAFFFGFFFEMLQIRVLQTFFF
jgi:hypothetical protein